MKYPILIIFALIPYIFLLVNIDAQDLICDDYSMFYLYREHSLLDTAGKIITGINNAHIRMTFIPHLFFIGFYRYSNGGPFATNLFFLILLGLIISTIVLLLLIINSRKTKRGYEFRLANLSDKENIFLFAIASYLLASQYIWSLLDFKLANYLTFGLFTIILLLLISYKNQLRTRIGIISYFLFYVVTVHSTDVNPLILAIVIPVIFLKKISFRTRCLLSTLMILYPPSYYFALKAVLNRDSILFNDVSVGTLFSQFRFWVGTFIEFNQTFFLTLGAILIVATTLTVAKFIRSTSLKNKHWINVLTKVHKYLFDQEKNYTIGVFFSIFPLLLLIITNFAYGGWINPHQFGFAYLLFILSFVALTKSLLDNLPNHKRLIVGLVSLSLVFIVYQNVGDLVEYWKTRRTEVSVITSIENHVKAKKYSYGDKNYIVIDSWPNHKFPTYTAFYNVSWASKDYAQFYLDSDSQTFQILSPHAVSHWGLDLAELKDSDTENSSLIHVRYNNQTETAEITDYNCSLMCGEKAIELLETK
ncbi:hypothetical protein GF389_03700 [Candidatus Dojkabacteria bacterium]|nr:hypothetical protein [Candidatus Dojkabacteria bacterium]